MPTAFSMRGSSSSFAVASEGCQTQLPKPTSAGSRELIVSSPAVTETISSTHCAYPPGMPDWVDQGAGQRWSWSPFLV